MIVKKILLSSVCSAVLLGSVAVSNPSTSGAFVQINGGGVYTKLKEYFRHSSQKADSQVEMLEETKKAGFYIGGGVGYGYEIGQNFYIGATIYGHYDATDVKNDEEKIFSKSILDNEGKTQEMQGKYKIVEGKPIFTYGMSAQVGAKVAANIIVGASIGVEGTYTKIKQYIISEGAFVQNDAGIGVIWAYKAKTSPGTADDDMILTLKGNGTEVLKTHLISVVPGVFAKYFITPNIFAGVQVEFPIGFNKKVDEKYYNQGLDYASSINRVSEGNKVAFSLTSTDNKLYIKRPFAVRYGLTIGYKF
jgi:hypothetical protein